MLMLTLMYLAIISGLAWIAASFIFHVTWGGLYFLLILALVCGVAALVMRLGRRAAA